MTSSSPLAISQKDEIIFPRYFTPDGELVPSPGEAAEQEKQRAEQEKQRAEQERQRAEQLEERLRSLGINPNEL